MIIFKTFQGLENFYVKFHTFPGSVRTLWQPYTYTSISQLHNKFHGHFDTPLEYVRRFLGAFIFLIIFIWHWQHCTVWKYRSN